MSIEERVAELEGAVTDLLAALRLQQRNVNDVARVLALQAKADTELARHIAATVADLAVLKEETAKRDENLSKSIEAFVLGASS